MTVNSIETTMNPDPEKFKVSVEGITYMVHRSASDKNIYRLNSPRSSYMIARDFYGIWVELTSKTGSPHIPLSKIGEQIEHHYKTIDQE